MYTLSEAARAVGKSKAAISKAIKSGKLTASKGENGRYIIDPVDLTRVYPVNPTGGAVNEEVNGPVGDAGLDFASGVDSGAVNPHGERLAAEVNDEVNPADSEVNDTSSAEHRVLRAQVDQLMAALERERTQSDAQIDRLITALEAATSGRRFEPGSSYRANGADHRTATRAPSLEAQTPTPDLQNENPDLAAMCTEMQKARGALASATSRMEAKLDARPGLVIRFGLTLVSAWCLMSGAYVVAILHVFGTDEILRIGRIGFRTLYRDLWSLLPF